MKKRKAQIVTKKVKKPSAAQLRDVEFSQEVRHLSTSELNYRMQENARQTENARLDMAELDARRKALSATHARLTRDRAVLRSIIDLRQLSVQID